MEIEEKWCLPIGSGFGKGGEKVLCIIHKKRERGSYHQLCM